MAKTTADATLVQGAKDMGKASMPVDMKGLDKIIKVGDDMQAEVGKKIKTEVDERKTLTDAFEKDAESIILNSGSLGKTLYNDTFDMVSGYKAQYLKAIQNKDEKGKMAALQGMQAQSLFIKDHKDYRLDMASKIDNKEYSDGMSKSNIHNLKAIQGENYTLGKNDKDETTFNFKDLNGKDVSMTHNEYTKLYEPKNFEITTTTAKLMSEVIKTGQYNEFDVENQITQIIPDDEQGLRAAMGDDILGKKFNVLLAEDEGLDAELIASLSKGGFNSWDVDKDGVIDPEEKTNFIDAVTNFDNPNFDLKASKQIFVNKLSNIVGNHHNQNQVKLKAEKDKKTIEDNKSSVTKKVVNKRITAPATVDLVKPDGTYLTDVSTADLRRIDSALEARKPGVGIAGNFGYYYPDSKGKYHKYNNQEDFIFMNTPAKTNKGSGLFNFEEARKYANINGLSGGSPTSISSIRSDEKTESGKDSFYTETSTTTKD